MITKTHLEIEPIMITYALYTQEECNLERYAKNIRGVKKRISTDFLI